MERKSKIGLVFGHLRVISFKRRDKWNKRIYVCICKCGEMVNVSESNLHPKRKGCKFCYKSILPKHGMRHTRVYDIWCLMKARCLNKNNSNFHRYGGRGIKISKSWKSFENFYKDMGDPPTNKHSIDRIDNNKGYSKENCRWSTNKEQCNNKTNNRRYEINGITKNLTQWCELHSIQWNTVNSRLMKGMTILDALTTPVMSAGRRTWKPT